MPSFPPQEMHLPKFNYVSLLLGRFQAILLKTLSVLLGEVPALPGVVQAYVQVGTGREAPQ